MIEVSTNFGPDPAPPRYFYVVDACESEESEAPERVRERMDWSDFVVLLMRVLMPFDEARQAVIAAVAAYEGASP